MLNSEMLYFRTIIIVRKLTYYKLNECSKGYIHTLQVKQLNHIKLTLHQNTQYMSERLFPMLLHRNMQGFPMIDFYQETF